MTTERRFCEFRAEGRRLTGTAIRYANEARMPWGRERFAVAAFAPLGDVLMNAQHDRRTPLARTGAGLTMTDTAEALRFDADLPATRAADDVLELVRTGVLRGASIEFESTRERMESDLRVIERATLKGVSIVDTPAYSDSEIEARMAAMAPAPTVTATGRRRVWL